MSGWELRVEAMLSCISRDIEVRIIFLKNPERRDGEVKKFKYTLKEEDYVWTKGCSDAIQSNIIKLLTSIWEQTPLSKEEIRAWLYRSDLLDQLRRIMQHSLPSQMKRVAKFSHEKVKCRSCRTIGGSMTPCVQQDCSEYVEGAVSTVVDLPRAQVVGDLVVGLWDSLFGKC